MKLIKDCWALVSCGRAWPRESVTFPPWLFRAHSSCGRAEPCPPQNIWLPYTRVVPHVLPPPCGLREADGAELLHSSFWGTTSAPLRPWKILQDPVVPRRPQHILGAVKESRQLGCGRRPFQTFLVAAGKPWVGNTS